jgi:hypothetical protein
VHPEAPEWLQTACPAQKEHQDERAMRRLSGRR